MKEQINQVKNYLIHLQDEISMTLKHSDEKAEFIKDDWHHTGGGGGDSRLIRNGYIYEQAGVNFSHVQGERLPASAAAHRNIPADSAFNALGVSMVFHPQNPYVPTMHANVRAFFMEPKDAAPVWWFGGGFDLTPYYGFDEDCKHWHRIANQACAPFGDEVYPRYKKWADDYFYLKHRKEPRGIGGIFFDDLNEWEFNKCFDFMQSVGNAILPAYIPIVERRKDTPFTDRERAFQLYRRGRYVEFNLVYDRGTLFGLQSGGRTESILMSLPPQVRWQYGYHPEAGSIEAQFYENYLLARDWLS